MKIAVGCDHRGQNLKSRLCQWLQENGHEVCDAGPDSEQAVDYPDVAAEVAQRVSRGAADRGVLICGTGIGMAIAANKFHGVRAAAVRDEFEAEMSRRHNNLNVLCLSGDLIGERNIDRLMHVWLETEFEGGRHARRLGKIEEIEKQMQGEQMQGEQMQGE